MINNTIIGLALIFLKKHEKLVTNSNRIFQWNVFSILALGVDKQIYLTRLEGVWWVSGRCLEDVWRVSGKCMGGVWIQMIFLGEEKKFVQKS